MVKNLFLVFLGGGFGSMLRYGATFLWNHHFPYGTLVVNLLGSLLIGIFLGLYEKQIFAQMHWMLLIVGFCGGFTTFSSFAVENLKMLQSGALTSFFIYTFGSVVLGIALVYVGFRLARLVV